MTDVLHTALTTPIPGRPLIVERSDGHTSVTDLDWWLRRPGARPPADFGAVDRVRRGPVLDVGCATGRGLERLMERGIDAYGIDTCPAALAQAHRRGLRAFDADVLDHAPPAPVRSVLLLGGGLGIPGTKDAVPAFLRHLSSWLAPDGEIIASSVDWTSTADKHRAWIDAARSSGRYPGDVRLRLRYADLVGDWFGWTWIDPDTLTALAAAAGLAVSLLERTGSWYTARIVRKGQVDR